MKFATVILLTDICITVEGWPCVSPIKEVYNRINTDAVLQFLADLTNLNSPRMFTLRFHDGTTQARIRYNTDRRYTTDTKQGVNITGDTAGNVFVTLQNVQLSSAGIYTIEANGVQLGCNCLYILGTLTKPTITLNKVPSVGESAALTCRSTSTTTPSNHSLSVINNWRVDDFDNPGGSKYSYSTNKNTLTLSNIVKDDVSKQFTCTATEDVTDGYTSSRSDSFSFDVHYGPENMNFNPNDESYERVENTNLNQVTCGATCHPTCSFKWSKIGQAVIVSNTSVLSLGSLTSSIAGTYTCTATRPGGFLQTKDLTVNVIYGPDAANINERSPYYITEGDTNINIECSSDCYPGCSYTWTNLTSGTSISANGVLSLGTVNRYMAGDYKCMSSNTAAQLTKSSKATITTIVKYGPDTAYVNVQSPYYITEGDTNINIECSSDCYPGCSYTWTNLTSGTRISLKGVLSIGTVHRYMTGDYKCISNNTAAPLKSSEATITTIVKYAPDVSTRLSNTNTREGENLTLFCDGVGVPPTSNYISLSQTWNNVEIPNNNKALSGTHQYSSIHFSPLKLEDTGTYTCVLTNGIRDIFGKLNLSSSRNIVVEVRPKVLTDELRFTGSAGGTARVHISIYSYPTLTDVTVTKYDGTGVSSDIFNVSEQMVKTTFYGKSVLLNGSAFDLMMENLKEDDFGNYTLKLTNRIGTTYIVAFIIAAGRPSPPKEFRYLSDNGIPTFKWERNFNGGKIQSFVIQISTAGTERWTNYTNIQENDEQYQINRTFFSAKISDLQPGTYYARIFSNNSKGESETVDLGTPFEVIRQTEGPTDSVPIAGIAGGSVAVIVVILIVGGFLVMLKSRAKNKDDNKKKLGTSDQYTRIREYISDKNEAQAWSWSKYFSRIGNKIYGISNLPDTRTLQNEKYASMEVKRMWIAKVNVSERSRNRANRTEEDDDDESEVNTVNPMYAPADEVMDTTYSQPMKKQNLEANDEYAVVDKKPKKGKKDKNISEKASKKRKKTNTFTNKSKNAHEENLYENQEPDVQPPKKLVNLDGLVYADLTFNDQPKGQNKQVIAGLDSMTEYVEVDFTKKAEPLPESDEESDKTKA